MNLSFRDGVGFVLVCGFLLGFGFDVRATSISLSPTQHLVTLLATNDIHGGVEPSMSETGERIGGLAIWSGVVRAIRTGLNHQYGDRASVLVLDSGDQFQGTLVSNFNEGELVFELMNQVGYDAAIPGNHDYDFGPRGWLQDTAGPGENPRGALEHLAGDVARFPLLSANTYLKASILDSHGVPVNGDGVGCHNARLGRSIAWDVAQRPGFLKPYRIFNAQGVRVAVIGIDNPHTPETTTEANVSDLCFRDEAETYREVRASLEGQADVYVMVLHNGNIGDQYPINNMIKRINTDPAHPHVHAVLAGHTHAMNLERVEGVPIIQSNAGGRSFGRVDLVWDSASGRVDPTKTRAFAGIDLHYQSCDARAAEFCNPRSRVPSYEGENATPDPVVEAVISKARAAVAPFASRVIGHAVQPVVVDRINESPMANALTDELRKLSGADVAMMNTGGIRSSFKAGVVTYEDLFRVIPFNNHALVVGPMSVSKVLEALRDSIMSCGKVGALMQSGLRVKFSKNCEGRTGGVDPGARLLHVETVGGAVLFDQADSVGAKGQIEQTLQVATLDFIANGGSGYDQFRGLGVLRDLGILREVMTIDLITNPRDFGVAMDGRWEWVK